MYALTTMFHLASLVALIWAIWHIARLKAANDFSLKLWRCLKGDGRIMVDNPDRFFVSFAASLGIPIESVGSKPQEVSRIDPRPWLLLYENCGIKKLKAQWRGKQEKGVLHVYLDKVPHDVSTWREKLMSGPLSSKIDINLQ